MKTLLKLFSVAGMATSLAACGGGSADMSADMAADPATRASGAPVAATPSSDTGGAAADNGSGPMSAGAPPAPAPQAVPVPAEFITTKTTRDANGGIRIDNRDADRLTLSNASGYRDVLYHASVNGTQRSTYAAQGLPPGLFTDGTSSLFGASFSSDGASFASVGFRTGTDGEGEYIGGYVRATDNAQTSGSASYSGDYSGFMADGSSPTPIYGVANIDADFDAGTFYANITDRALGGTGDVESFDQGILAGDVSFAGSIDGDGMLRAGHDDGNSVGSLTGQAHMRGVVGMVEVNHSGAGTSPSTALEVGTFSAE